MSKVLTFSRVFPSYHPRKGEPTNFIEKVLISLYPKENYYACGCKDCGFQFMSCAAEGGGQIADTGDYSDALCPKCNSSHVDDSKFELENEYYSHLFLPKYHTIRAGNRWRVGDKFSPRVWSGKPYASKQIVIAPDIEVKKVFDIKIEGFIIWINKEQFSQFQYSNRTASLSKNDGLSVDDFWNWFPCKPGKIFEGQIIAWSDSISY